MFDGVPMLMRASVTKSRRSPGWKGPTKSVNRKWSGSMWTRCWTLYAPTRASATSCTAWVFPLRVSE